MKLKREQADLYFAELDIIETDFYNMVAKLEEKMQKELHNKDIEFFWVDGQIVGIGTPNCPKDMKLLHRDKWRISG